MHGVIDIVVNVTDVPEISWNIDKTNIRTILCYVAYYC
jgi:hypothetical protein